jgi:RHS repeat-associated protein
VRGGEDDAGGVHSITGTETLNARFPGQWFQIENGLHYNWHRHYDPTLGRYTQPDPLGFVDGPGVYGYVRAKPLSVVDPLGLMDHHYFPQASYRDLPLSADTRRVFDKATVDVGPHGWSGDHLKYNRITNEMFNEFCAKNGIDPKNPRNMTPEQARNFISSIANSNNPVIRDLIRPNINVRPGGPGAPMSVIPGRRGWRPPM